MILFDGGMGTMLQKFGLEAGSCPDYYNISHPDVVQQIHRAYMEAGSRFITTKTFSAEAGRLRSVRQGGRNRCSCSAECAGCLRR